MRTEMTGKRKVIHTLLPSYGHVHDDREMVSKMEGVPIELISYSYVRDCDQMITFCDEIFCR